MTETKRIFVSHKARNAKITSDMLDILKSGMTGVEFFLSEQIEPGDNWRSDIVREIKSADCLLLLYLDPDQDWSWCMFEAGLFSANKPKNGERRLYCIQYPGSPPPDPLSEIQTTSATFDGMKVFLKSFYLTTKQTDSNTWANLDQTASRLVDFLQQCRPKGYETTNLRPSVLLYPAWAPTDRPDWRPVKVPKSLPLDRSEVVIENQKSVFLLGFDTNPQKMNIVDFLKRLDTDGSDVRRPWMEKFLDSLQSTLEGRMTEQHVVYFRSAMGNILRPIIESVKRSDDGAECECRVVFVDAFAPPASSNPSRMQLLANGLRLAVRTRLEVLDKYRGVMAQESARLARSKDPAEALGKLHPLGSRILESIRTIVLEAELQGTNLNAPPANLFHDDDKQATYETIRNRFRSWFEDFRDVTSREDKEFEGKYIQTEQLLDELYDLHSKYIAIAAPTLLNMLEASHQRPDEPGDNDAPARAAQGPDIGEPSLSNMRETVGTLCSMIEAGAFGRGGPSAPRVLG
jgi:TIR domain